MIRREVVIAALIVTCLQHPSMAAQQHHPPAQGTVADLGWLSGTWVGASGPATFEEHWSPAAGGAMLAVSRTIKGDAMVAFEFLRIVERGGTLVYIAQPGGRPPTDFTMTALSAESVTFENPAHDFPKMIRYAKRPDGGVEARVSDGGDRAEIYIFTRRQ
jgi:hypothetical protein